MLRIEIMPDGRLRLTKDHAVIVLEQHEVDQVSFMCTVTKLDDYIRKAE